MRIESIYKGCTVIDFNDVVLEVIRIRATINA
nr:MAG TPA: hypothetical protein [Caudoviricetes sp.]